MSDRLKTFRNLMAAFEGSSNPQRAIAQGFYIDLPNNPVGEIARRVELRPSSVHLLLGGIGSGKTTQLLLATERLNTLEDIKAIYVDVTLYTDVSDLQPEALMAIAGLELLKLLDDEKISCPDEYRKIIKDIAHGYTETRDSLQYPEFLKVGMPNPRTKVIRHSGLLENKRETGNIDLIRAFFNIGEKVRQAIDKKVIFLFDGLDRLTDSQVFINSALKDIIQIQKLRYGSILVGSVLIAYKERGVIENFTGESYYLPYLDVIEDEEAHRFFLDILAKRDTENFISEPTRSLLISNSGGVMRDLMSLTQFAIEEAYFDGSENIESVHVEKAVWSLTRSKIAGLTKAGLETIKQILEGKNFFPQSLEDFELLVGGYILEYRYPFRRFAAHPVIAKYISNQLTASVANR